MSKNIIRALVIVILLVFGGIYINDKITENNKLKEELLVQNLNQEAVEYLKECIAAIEKGDYMKISQMTGGDSGNYKGLEGIKMKYLDKSVSEQVTSSHNVVSRYIIKFQAIETEQSKLEENFTCISGLYYITLTLYKSEDGWHLGSITKGEFFS